MYQLAAGHQATDGGARASIQVHLFELRDGSIASVREYNGDEPAMERLLASEDQA